MKFFKQYAILLISLLLVSCNMNAKNLDIKPVHIGFNGSHEFTKMYFFENNATIENSWMKSSLTPDELAQLLSKVDFKKQLIFVYSFGERMAAAGSLKITEMNYIPDPKSNSAGLSVIAYIGITSDKDCALALKKSYPFVVLVIDRDKNGLKFRQGGYTEYNFKDDCSKSVSFDVGK
jgi:hypothetical protein